MRNKGNMLRITGRERGRERAEDLGECRGGIKREREREKEQGHTWNILKIAIFQYV